MEKNCVIVFDQNEYGTYFTGQMMTGRVIITFNKSKKLKGIKLQICGFAHCQWKDKHGRKRPQYDAKNGKRYKKNCYYGREDYIATTTYLVGSESATNFTIDAGIHTFTFACPIPENCPSSFEGTYGHIRYLAKVTFERAGASDRTHNVGFTVLKLLDLNRECRLLKMPTNNEAMENFCLFQSKAVHLKVDILQTGYVPGQFVLISTHVNNESNFDCRKLMIFLNLRANYTSDTPCMRTTSEKITLVKKFCGPVKHNTRKDFAETIRVPATPPTCEHLSKVVRVSYEICVIAQMNHLMCNPKAVIPITIGNVPLIRASSAAPAYDDVPTTSAGAMQMLGVQAENSEDNEAANDDEFEYVDDMEAGTTDTESLSNAIEETTELPPPTYEEAMFMSADIADNDVNTVSETTRFTPRYPVYNVDDVPSEMNNAQNPAQLPQKPKKRRRRRRRQPAEQQQPHGTAAAAFPATTQTSVIIEKPPMESPIEI